MIWPRAVASQEKSQVNIQSRGLSKWVDSVPALVIVVVVVLLLAVCGLPIRRQMKSACFTSHRWLHCCSSIDPHQAKCVTRSRWKCQLTSSGQCLVNTLATLSLALLHTVGLSPFRHGGMHAKQCLNILSILPIDRRLLEAAHSHVHQIASRFVVICNRTGAVCTGTPNTAVLIEKASERCSSVNFNLNPFSASQRGQCPVNLVTTN